MAVVAVIGLLNALLWPLLSSVPVPFAVYTLGLAALVMNGLVVMLANFLLPNFSVDSLWWAIMIALGLTAVAIIASTGMEFGLA